MAAAVGAGLFLIPLNQKRAGLAAATILLVAGVITLKDFLPALIWAAIFAIGLWPTFSNAAHRWPMHRHELIPMLSIVIVLLVFIIPVVMISKNDLIASMPDPSIVIDSIPPIGGRHYDAGEETFRE